MPASQTVDLSPDTGTLDVPGVSVPASPADLFGRFPDAAAVGIAAAAFPLPDDPRWSQVEASTDGSPGWRFREGVAYRIAVSPGWVSFQRRDYARLDRSAERAALDRARRLEGYRTLEGPVCSSTPAGCRHDSCRWLRRDDPPRRGRVTAWSRKSRTNMTRVLNALDWTAFAAAGAPAMVTLTYPGDWLAVAPSAAVCSSHLRNLRKRYQRAWGSAMVGVWKREFQARGAPHFHLLIVPPAGRDARERTFREWLSEEWAAVVAHPDPVQRALHVAAGTNVDAREGARYSDPRRIGVYFSKHGQWASKEYQNVAPVEWDAEDGVGRFWGVWGLDKAVVAREVPQDGYQAAKRAARRLYRAERVMVSRPVWRKVTTVDRETGEVGWKWRRRNTRKRLGRLAGRSGFSIANDGPGLALQLARIAAEAEGRLLPATGGFRAWSAAAGGST